MKENIPNHVAIIMDGNGRWATLRGKKRSEGHLEGSKTFEKLAIHAINRGIKVFSVFAFSVDNFKREQEEVDYLMNLFIKLFTTKLKKIQDENIKVIFSGRKEPLREDVLKVMRDAEEKTKNNTRGILNVCLNYGGQESIIDATKKVAEQVQAGLLKPEDITKETFSKYFYHELPPIDLLIRTSGEYRVSNFMLYEMSYAELYFTDTYFPDFKEAELDKALEAYQNRDRRFGGIKKS